MVFKDPKDYESFKLGMKLEIKDAVKQVDNDEIVIKDIESGKEYVTISNFSELEKKMIKNGGKINMIKNSEEKK